METSCLTRGGRGGVSGLVCKGLFGLLLYAPVCGGMSEQRGRERGKRDRDRGREGSQDAWGRAVHLEHWT